MGKQKLSKEQNRERRQLKKKYKLDREGKPKLGKDGQPKRNRHIVRKVLLVLVAVIAAAIVFNVVSCNVEHSKPQVPHEAAAAREEEAAQRDADGIAAYEALSANDGGLYVSDSAVGWDQTTEDLSGQAQIWDVTYDGDDASQIVSTYCTQCHTDAQLTAWSGTQDEAVAMMESMRDDYGAPLTDEQVQVMADLYAAE